MTIPDTIPAWMSETQPIPDCPSWCMKPTGHGFIVYPELGVLDMDRDHDAFRADVVKADGMLLSVSVYCHESYNADEGLYRSPVMVFVDGAEGLTLADLVALNAVLRAAQAVFTTISADA